MRRFFVALGTWIVLTSAVNLLIPGSPADRPWLLMIFACMFVPPTAFVLMCRRSTALRREVLKLDFGVLTVLQIGRVAGIAMLCLWAVNEIAWPFAAWTGILDVFVGLSAMFVAYGVTQIRPLPRRALSGWHIFGIAEFVLAVPLAILWSATSWGTAAGDGPTTSEMWEFPLSFIPMVGVPFLIIMHLIALMQLRSPEGPTLVPLRPRQPVEGGLRRAPRSDRSAPSGRGPHG